MRLDEIYKLASRIQFQENALSNSFDDEYAEFYDIDDYEFDDACEDYENDSADYENYCKATTNEKICYEGDKSHNSSGEINIQRKKTICCFEDGITYNEFTLFVEEVKKEFKRIKHISIDGPIVKGIVKSQSGRSDWLFEIDFNNWGHLTGAYWMYNSNADSKIPYYFAIKLYTKIRQSLTQKGIILEDLADIVDSNKNLEALSTLRFVRTKSKTNNHFSVNIRQISMPYDVQELTGEHIYPVMSILIRAGFNNIRTVPIRDVNDKNGILVYEVSNIIIAGKHDVKRNSLLRENVEIVITYHEKQLIRMPFSELELMSYRYEKAVNLLKGAGYTEIIVKKVNDESKKIVLRNGVVTCVRIGGEDGSSIKKNMVYEYDTKIEVFYRLRKLF